MVLSFTKKKETKQNKSNKQKTNNKQTNKTKQNKTKTKSKYDIFEKMANTYFFGSKICGRTQTLNFELKCCYCFKIMLNQYCTVYII